ncbi:MAG: acyl-CoA dehydrogenase family protein [Myxococcales bacterium]
MSRTSYVQTTHEVFNQPTPRQDFDAFANDAALVEGVRREAPEWVEARVSPYGAVVGSARVQTWAAQANKFAPELRSHDRYGHRVDEVDYHPAYHELMREAMAHEVHSLTWTQGAREERGGHVAHAALLYLHAQAEPGTSCPLTMTHASVPALRAQPELAALWEPRLCGTDYDPRCIPASDKKSATIGMAMTEKQGGSDVRANTTRAQPIDLPGPGHAYELTGHKWFCSAPMSDAFLTLAQTHHGLSCFLVPRFLPDGNRNRFLIQRLKDKLGNRSNASSEIEYDRTFAQLVGEEGRGVPTIIQMVAQTRVDCAAGSAGLMRKALCEAIHHSRERSAFGKRLSEHALMQSVLADMALEVEAATALFLRVARSYDDGRTKEMERVLARSATPIAKYWVTHRTPRLTFEAMECLGGAGYVEESGLPLLYREAPVNSIWEGSGNVQCLDVLRALGRDPAALEALLGELDEARGADATLDAVISELKHAFPDVTQLTSLEARARYLVERFALTLAASLLFRHAPEFVASAFCATRLGGQGGAEYGAFSANIESEHIIERALAG